MHPQTSFPVSDDETLRTLRGHAARAGRHAGRLVTFAMHAAAGGGFDVARTALDELLVRFDRSKRDRPELLRSPSGWLLVGTNEVWITPTEASCDCDDFIRASLGACVHVLGALRYGGTPIARYERPSVVWNPIRPLDGAEPWTARMHRTGSGELVAPSVCALMERDARLRIPTFSRAEIDAALATLHLPLYPYQREGVTAFFASGRLVLADDMGLGKTAQAIAITHVLFAVGAIARAIVVVPAPLRWQWAAEWSRFSDARPAILEANQTPRDGISIVSYEQARGLQLERYKPDFVILDEAQRIKNAHTLTARSLRAVTPRWRLALTGTPLENRLDDLASIVGWVDDLALEPSWRLRAWHTIRNDAKRAIGVHGLDTIRARIAPYFLRRLRSEVLGDLPARRDTRAPLLLTPRQREMHDNLQLAIARLVGAGPLGPEQYLQLQCLLAEQRLVCNGVALAKFADYWAMLAARGAVDEDALAALHSPKLGALRDLLSSIVVEQGRKVVVFSQWRRMLRLAERTTSDVLGDDASVYFSGNESMSRRIDNLARFQRDPNVRVLWSTDTGALGLNLQAAASCCINLDLPWNPAVLEQRVARVYRLGQTEPVDVYNLVTIDGIEGRIEQLLAAKQSIADRLFASRDDEVLFEAPPAPNALVLALACVGSGSSSPRARVAVAPSRVEAG